MSQSITISLKQAIIGNQEEEDKLFNLYAYMHKETLKLISCFRFCKKKYFWGIF